MALPETIAVKYTEEEAQYLSVRPVVRQTFRLEELLDMLLCVAGKDVARLQQILRAGTAVYNFYRYWWPGFETTAEELASALARFPEADPSRPFRAKECVAVLLETAGGPGRPPAELSRQAASRKRWFRRASLWDCLTGLTGKRLPVYQTYSYARRADLFAIELTAPEAELLVQEALRLAPRALRPQARLLARARRLLFVCPRRDS